MKITILLFLLYIHSAFIDIGFNLAYFILGMGGGFVRSIAKDGVDLKRGVINIIVGGIVSSWFTGIVCKRLALSEREQIFATALALGFFAMGAFLLWERIEEWARRNPKFFISLFINWLTNATKNLNANDSRTDRRDADDAGSDTTAKHDHPGT